jgi:hypothetical protein
MQLHLNFSSTPLIAGLCVSYLLHYHAMPIFAANLEFTFMQRVLQALLGAYVNVNSGKWVKPVVIFFFNNPGVMVANCFVLRFFFYGFNFCHHSFIVSDLKFHVCNFIDPIWVVCLSVYSAFLVRRSFHILLAFYRGSLDWQINIRAKYLLGAHLPTSLTHQQKLRLLKLATSFSPAFSAWQLSSPSFWLSHSLRSKRKTTSSSFASPTSLTPSSTLSPRTGLSSSLSAGGPAITPESSTPVVSDDLRSPAAAGLVASNKRPHRSKKSRQSGT